VVQLLNLEKDNGPGRQCDFEGAASQASTLLTSCTSCLSAFQQVRAAAKDRMEVMDLIGLVNKQIRVKEAVIGKTVS